jgi:hypothetical protein
LCAVAPRFGLHAGMALAIATVGAIDIHLVVTGKEKACPVAVNGRVHDEDEELSLGIALQRHAALPSGHAAFRADTGLGIREDDLLDRVEHWTRLVLETLWFRRWRASRKRAR